MKKNEKDCTNCTIECANFSLIIILSIPYNFGFRQKYSTVHALISLTENIRKNVDKVNIGCVIFVDLQKAFDTIEHDIFLSKLEHYGIQILSLK